MKLIVATLLALPMMACAKPTSCEDLTATQTRIGELQTVVYGDATEEKTKAQAELEHDIQRLTALEAKCEASKLPKELPPPHLGMTTRAVLEQTSFGAPDHINRTVTAGRVVEQWVYDGVYLYFTNGRLTAFQD
jgi:hypothetical protein